MASGTLNGHGSGKSQGSDICIVANEISNSIDALVSELREINLKVIQTLILRAILISLRSTKTQN
jgi:hypothetical protein